jgi:hypothetical protein
MCGELHPLGPVHRNEQQAFNMSYAGKLVTGLGKGGGVSVTVRADHASIEGLIRHGRE